MANKKTKKQNGKKPAQKKPAPKKQRRWIPILIAAICLCIAAGVGIYFLTRPSAEPGNNEPSTEQTDSLTEQSDPAGTMSGKHHVEIEIADYGTISVELDADAAPITVENFIQLANEGFYDGLTFHRIMEGFMMQGGDPNGDGTGGSPDNIKGEFSNNGVDNPLSHTRGAISMARQGNPYNPASAYDTASSQFFIVHQDSTFLDGDYACFGYVTDGMDIVDKICTEAQPIDDNGMIPPSRQPVITTIRVID